MEIIELALTGISGIMFLAGCIWIAIIAFQNDETLMGIFSLICGIVALVYGIQNMEQCKVPLIILAFGFVGNIVSQMLSMGA